MSFKCVASVLVHHPYIIIIGLTIISGTCLIIPLSFRRFPNFSDPQMGFETRGTVLSSRTTAWKNLVESTRYSGPLTVNPKKYIYILNATNRILQPKRRKEQKKVRQSKKENAEHPKRLKNEGIVRHSVIVSDKTNRTKIKNDNWTTLQKMLMSKPVSPPKVTIKEGYFCGPPTEGYAQLVFKADNGSDLFNWQSLYAMCRIQTELTQAPHFKELCAITGAKPKKCCKPWSLVNYIALLHNHTSCLGVTEDDVNSTKSLLGNCAKYYHNLRLSPDCDDGGRCAAPKECIRYDAVFNILNFLVSTSFAPPNNTDEMELKETMIFLPIACSTASLLYYTGLTSRTLTYEGVSVVAMEFGLKNYLFDKSLVDDVKLIAVGGMFVVVCIWLYTKSLFITIMTIIAIVFSLGISYFLYTLVFELEFFPFMNLMAVIVAIGIGADDAFVFYKVWQSTKNEECTTLIFVMSTTLRHAMISMFVTSLTTAVAFLASYLSSITAIRCFGVFAGMSVIANYALMVSWLPAVIVIWEKFRIAQCGVIKSCFLVCLERLCCSPQWKVSVSKIKKNCAALDKFWKAPETYILDAVIKFKFFLFITFTLIAVASAIIVFYYPMLKLPNNNEFQLFDSSHPFEQYDLVYKIKFWFNHAHKMSESNLYYKLPLRFIWGVLPQDNGNYMNPQSLGDLKLDDNFNISDPKSQQWLLDFCWDLRKQPFYQHTLGPLLPNCFIESFKTWMERRCVDPIDETHNRTPCCESATFPFESDIFNLCIVDAISELYETPAEYFMPGMAGPKFSKDQLSTIKAVVVEYDSNYSFSMSYGYMKKFLNDVESWMAKKLQTAPLAMKGGWFVSQFEFYDLQSVLSYSTSEAVVFSMALALLVLFLTTLNILLSLYAIFTISCSIITTMALLVLFGWKLNILESVAISSSIGLTVDFSLHFSVNYRLCPLSICDNREKATKYSLAHMLGPVTMAALTTGAAGFFMMPSQVLAYQQIGQFLVTVMIVSWLYAIFHLGSLLAIAGPQKRFGQYYYSTMCKCNRAGDRSTDARQTASTVVSESHEMETLTDKGGPRTNNPSLRRSVSVGKNPSSRNPFSDQSPSATSAITIIMADDN